MVAVGRSMGRIYPGQTAARTGYDYYQPLPSVDDQLDKGRVLVL